MSLEKLAGLIHDRNKLSSEIAALINRPALNSHIGEYIALKIFNIKLASSANAPGIDGWFTDSSLKDRTVNVKIYGKNAGILDISKVKPDYYLVLTGPDGAAESSKGKKRPLVITQTFLFNRHKLLPELKHVKVGVATSVRKSLWKKAMIYPDQNNSELVLTHKQKSQIALFQKNSLPKISPA